MNRKKFTVGSINKNWYSVSIASGGGFFYWLNQENKLCRAQNSQGLKPDQFETIAPDWHSVEFAVDDTSIYWIDEQKNIRSSKLKNGALVSEEGTILLSHKKTLQIDVSGEYLYWLDESKTLLRCKIDDASPSQNIQVVANDFNVLRFAIDQNRIAFLSEDTKSLYLSAINGGQLASFKELISNKIDIVQIVADQNQLYFLDTNYHLRRAKQLGDRGFLLQMDNSNEEGHYYFHFGNMSDFKPDNEMVIKVGVYHFTLYYDTDLTPEHPTGIPYQPKYQHYGYLIRFFWWNTKTGQNKLLAEREDCDVEHSSKYLILHGTNAEDAYIDYRST